mmetsp:Transcript_9813/g.12157  ORF Transcript_9813/g.12157 Transcript_9813/m.12157 type:complete len:105 (+) Transcript_9813:65-379(+)|eukprot:CAMPEP_0172484422 /NCGR_PEP_ID=MMETSP1066-20121228/11893_1 /TAXON_ID=671091 /ORGANISM="Coscinodiscus wailesii, Strain CCMP2513" /LENGTH=104 /DNA_ID=CAMNT_0013248951 /DNA_START=57 /DNA_END=371 /DNA_ORIENTATION=+
MKYLKAVSEYDALVLESESKLVVIDFTATWCPPCRMIGPIFEQIAAENPDVICVKVDVDDANEIAEKCGIQAMPTFQFYKGGKMVHVLKGADQAGLRAKINELK